MGGGVRMLWGEAGVHGKYQGAGAATEHAQLAVVGVEVAAHETAAVKVDECRPIEPGPIRLVEAHPALTLLPLLDGAHVLDLTAEGGTGPVTVAAGLPALLAGLGATGGDKLIDHLGQGGFENRIHHASCIKKQLFCTMDAKWQ